MNSSQSDSFEVQHMKTNFLAACLTIVILMLSACASVKPYEREKLADPIMDPGTAFSKQSLEDKFYSTREGSMGGASGIGGGCGCAK